ncbi:MAG: hypothetical protein IJP44_15500 [Bacteroidales bacterium]|nr:hypothetical protein [Bacteroidales bacterium]
MKKFSIFSIFLMVVAITVAVVSCKKENHDAFLNNNAQPAKAFTPPQVDDMNAYLKEFKQRMQTATRGEDEMLSLEEAAWHLSSVANYDFANANVEFTDLRYDTLRYHIDVANGEVSLTDLNALYSNVAYDIDEFYHSLNLDGKHFRFIGADISESGEVTISLITTYVTRDHWWYFQDSWEAGVMCDSLFSDNITYVWNGNGLRTLQQALNLLEGKLYAMPECPPQRVFYVYSMDVEFNYNEYIDQYGSDFIGNSRIYAWPADTHATPTISASNMCYCLDSYLGLPFEYVGTHHNLANQRPVNWKLSWDQIEFVDQYKWDYFIHIVTVKLGRYVVTGNTNEY